MGTWMLYVTTLFVATAAQTCQRDWLNAEFVISSVGDQDVDLLTATSLGFDPTFSYFRDVIQFTDEETERFTQDAINFYMVLISLVLQMILDAASSRMQPFSHTRCQLTSLQLQTTI